ncbi:MULTISPECIES: peptidoglycan-binding domain-containing protein [unclassified Streptomyces]|uniref:peptidoglycan-binding domain-containing protein n=1 Tax=unclassified Streptomyces TaxID=2593676 RepID=UPI0001C19CE2|nr:MULTISPECIES: peptidoglycan-binding domain-containing protein [unclassified Streptomyces]AEN09738.1 Peptidoglycan-binding domain 1 protein [Streptomyces sp. SirexAA-E]MYR64699.1 peptidoglycan-binding protein [Streptomyces sp. SID4939]MYS01459.1 peptidoglycan-binding protein [Streptomyces sp. SID4940]MYT64404.1 peptidoglycan-binding protein [Streptomyces sp. SID8357]MYT87217.1 peptidoglycan-binding protein [Streptomyces sp. SID8360]
MTGHTCPECGGEPGARPGCACGAGTAAAGRDDEREPRTEEGHLAARTAEMAAAEDFDPLRIRPYVTLTNGDPADHGAPAEATTMRLHLGDVTAAPGAAPATTPGPGPGDETRRRTAAAYPGGGDPVHPRRRRPLAAVAVGAAVAAVVGTAAFAGGLFGGDESDEEALPEITTSVPDATVEPTESASASASPSVSSSPTASRSASASPSASASASPTASASPSASASDTAAAPPPSPSASPSASPSTAPAAPPGLAAEPTLRRGDQGPEVAELQRRLREKWIYQGPDDAHYSDRVERAVREFQRWVSVGTDAPGVYGPETRKALEAQTTGSGRPY